MKALARGLAALLLLGGVAATAQDKKFKKYDADGVWWAVSVKAAVDEAGVRNVPIHWVALQVGDPNSAKMIDGVYGSSAFINASRNWVNVVMCKEGNHEVEAVIDGKVVKVCAKFWGIPCEAHAECFQNGFSRFKELSTVPVTVASDGTCAEFERLQGEASASAIQKMMQKASDKIPGEKIPAGEYRVGRKLLDEADEAFKAEEWKKANDRYTAVSKSPRKGLRDLANAALKRFQAKGNELFMAAKDTAEVDKEAGLKELRVVADGFKPWPCSKLAADLIRELGK